MIRPDLDSLAAYVPGRNMPNALKLSSNEVVFGPLPAAEKAMAEAISKANRYPDMGAVALRDALSERLGFPSNQIAVSNGSSAMCLQLMQITCGKPTDEVMYAWRSFEAYPLFVRVANATAVQIPLSDDYRHDLDAMADAITENTRLIFICNPNNPTGTTITQAEFDAFMARVPENIIVALDEAYYEYNRAEDTPDAQDMVRKYPNVVGVRTFSKAYGLAGLRMGYAFGAPEIIEALNKVAIPFGVNIVAQAAAIESLRAQGELLERTDEVVRLRDDVSAHIGAIPSESNFVWIPTTDAAEIGASLMAAGAVVRTFPGEGVRVTISSEEEMEKFLKIWDSACS